MARSITAPVAPAAPNAPYALFAALAAVSMLFACATPPAEVKPPEVAVAAPQPAGDRPPAATASPRAPTSASASATLDGYKRDVAKHIHAANPAQVFEGAPPAILKSVVVLSIAVDAAGEVRSVSVQRSNGFRELEQRAMQSVRLASPLPRPTRVLVRGTSAGYFETWLFREDGKFQVRSVALAQERGGD